MAAEIRALVGLAAVLIGGGTVFFRWIEGWAWIDAYFFTVVTVSTVGYGNLVPETAIGKIGATVLIFLGIGVFATAVGLIGRRLVDSRLARKTDRDG
jgi:voltage-gated potassium channel